MIKLIASDMDGTLLNNKGELPEEFYRVFEELKQRNILFAAASGRQYFTLAKTFEKVMNDMIFIAENGTMVVYKGEELAVSGLNKQMAAELVKRGRTIESADIVVCTKTGAYVEKNHPSFIKEVEKYYVRYQVIEDLLQVKGEILKVTLYDAKGAEKNSNIYFDDIREDLQICLAGENWLDMMPKGIHKGIAIKELQQQLQISYEETAAFGDYLNDTEMLKNAYYSYAMENAHPELKEIARFSAKSNEDNGVIEKIKEIIA